MNDNFEVLSLKYFNEQIDLMKDCFSLAKLVIGEKFENFDKDNLDDLKLLEIMTPIALCFYKDIMENKKNDK